MSVAAGYERCREITRRNAGNFYYGIRLLPRDRRSALCCVYAFARRVDDVADGDLADDEKLRELEALRASLDRLDRSADPVLAALGDAAARYPIPLDSFRDLIDGAEMDVAGAGYETFDDLVVYCRRVAGSIGRLSLGVFGARDPASAGELGDDLGVAFQVTNILRDVREDWETGRVYLPREDLDEFDSTPPAFSPDLIRFEAERAQRWFDRGLELLPLLDRPAAASVSAMAGIYRRLLDRIQARPELVLVGPRLSLPAREKAWVAARSLVGADRRRLGGAGKRAEAPHSHPPAPEREQ
ncbi:MAG TPA: squalene/phytoene synthase family protein [Gaiellaceae bacterium]|jgi:phytoene synthase|nr:squalene/phytoene synthase family protein [Gaiellaceae bacterium]